MTQTKEFTDNPGNCRPQTAGQAPVLQLSPAEGLLRQLILACRDSIVSSENDVTNLDMWFVGGWVRDRLLDRQSSDIDVALSSMTGIQFGHALDHYLESEKDKYIEEAKRLGVPPVISKLHEIKKNSEKSKHLETGCFPNIFGLSVDFVNLRKESYSKESTIPQMEFGTPEEDAHRCDATIDALFYNLNTGIVEDHTGFGLHDLASGVIRTPSCPSETFNDDPLRVLRLIRFAAQLGFRIEEETMNAMRAMEIPEQLCTKVSHERVEAELEKILKGPNTLPAFQLIHELYLYSAAFLHTLPWCPEYEDDTAEWLVAQWGQNHAKREGLLQVWGGKDEEQSRWARAFETVAFLLSGGSKPLRDILLQPERLEDIWMLTAFVPLGFDWIGFSLLAGRGVNVPEFVSRARDNEHAIRDYMREVNGEFNGNLFSPRRLSRGTLGALIRLCGRSWRLQVLYALLHDDCELAHGKERLAWLEKWSRFVEYISEQRLEDAPYVKPILNGHEILSLYDREKGGPKMQDALEDIVRWQFDHENATKEEAMDWMLTRKEMYPF
jgi:tRNA nucleotidyltransferase/poly(A) polymerase